MLLLFEPATPPPVGAVELLATDIGTAPLTLPAHLAGDLFVCLRGRALSTVDTVADPWFDAFVPHQDSTGNASSLQVVWGIAPSDDGLTYPLTGSTSARHMYWHFRGAVVGAQIDSDSATGGTEVTVPSLAGLDPTSWVAAGFYSRNAQTLADLELMVPEGYVVRRQPNSAVNSMILYDSDGPTGGTTFPGDSATMTSETDGWAGFAIEIGVA